MVESRAARQILLFDRLAIRSFENERRRSANPLHLAASG
jgi:hypothetical protein